MEGVAPIAGALLSPRFSARLATVLLAAVLLVAGLPCASHLPGDHPAWSVALLCGAAAVHALALAAFCSLLPWRPARVACAALIAAWVGADARLYGLIGLHIDRSTFGNALEPQAATTLGVTFADFIPVLASAFLAGTLLFFARPARRFAALAALVTLDLLIALPLSLARFEGVQPLVGLADAMPLAWNPRPEHLYARLTGHPPLAVDDDLLFPLHGVFENVLQRLAVSPLPSVAVRRPDILLITVESLRADALGAMPALQALARESLSGERHYGAGNCSFLSNFSLLTGLLPSYWRVGETWRAPQGLGAFVALGYDVEIKFSAALNFGVTEASLPPGAGVRVPTPLLDPDARDDANARWAAEWARAPRSRPSMALLFMDGSHWPYWSGNGPPPYSTSDTWALRSHADDLHRRYLDSLSAIDRKLATVLAALRESGRWNDTIVVALGDHGEAFREHGVFSHGSRVDEEQIRVPLLVKLPGLAPGGLRGPSTGADVLPTLLGYLGATPLSFSDGIGTDLLSARPRAAPPLVGSCGIDTPTGYVALAGDRKVLFQLYGGAAHLTALQSTDGTNLPPRDDPEVSAILSSELHASRALLLPR